MTTEKMQRMQLVIQPALIEQVDKWRGQQPGVPNRSEAVRMLVALGLKAAQDEAASENG